MEQLLTVKQVAELMQLHEVTIRRYIRDGKLAAVRIGRRVRVPREAVDEFLSADAASGLDSGAVLREPAVTYTTSAADSSQAILAQMTADLTVLDRPNLLKVSEFVSDLKAEQEARKLEALAWQITKQAFQGATELSAAPREELWAQFNDLIEEVRQEAILKGTSIDGDWLDD